MVIFKWKYIKSWKFRIGGKSIDRISSRSIENCPKSIDRSNLCGARISETLANSINTILFSVLGEEAEKRLLGSALGAVLTVV